MTNKKKGASRFDVTAYLESEEDIAAYLNAAIEDGDPQAFIMAIGDVAKARGMNDIAKKTGMSRTSLYKALKETGDPKLKTIRNVMAALDLKLAVVSTTT